VVLRRLLPTIFAALCICFLLTAQLAWADSPLPPGVPAGLGVAQIPVFGTIVGTATVILVGGVVLASGNLSGGLGAPVAPVAPNQATSTTH